MDRTPADLSPRERDVLRLLAKGHDAKTAARALGRSVYTVNDHLKSARVKLGASSSRDLARRFAEWEAAHPKELGATDFGMAEMPPEPLYPGRSASRDAAAETIMVREAQATYAPFAGVYHYTPQLPLRQPGERDNEAEVPTRLKQIAELTAKMALAFAFLCLAAAMVTSLMLRMR